MGSSTPDPSSPQSISLATFPQVRKGADPEKVKEFLVAVAAEMQSMQRRLTSLEHERDEALKRAVDLESMDDAVLVELLDEEKARLLISAREEIRNERAEMRARLRQIVEEADRHVEQANLKISRLRESARLWAVETELHQRRLADQFDRARAVAADVMAALTPQSLTEETTRIETMGEHASDIFNEGVSAAGGTTSSADVESADEDEAPTARVVPLFPGKRHLAADVEHEERSAGDDEHVAEPEAAENATLSARDEALKKVVNGTIRQMKKTLSDELDEVLHAIDSSTDKRPRSPLAGAVGYQRKHLAGVADVLESAARSGARSVGADDDCDVSSAVADGRKVVVDELFESLRARVAQTVKDDGDDSRALVRSLRALYRETRGDRVGDVIHQAVCTAYAAAQIACAPEGVMLRWVPTGSGRPCPDCEDDSLSAPVASGSPFPTGAIRPPSHFGCRCELVVADD